MPEVPPFQADRLTVRVCEDLGWSIYASCGGCRAIRLVRGERAASSPGGRVPLGKALERRLFKCDACKTKSVDRISVSWLDVGRSKTVAAWELYDCGGRWLARQIGEA